MAANYPKGEKYYSQRELDAAVAAAEQKGRLEGAMYAAGVKAASDAVDALSSGIKGEGIPKTVYQYRNDALDAIDGAGEAMSRTTTRPERHYRMESVMEPGVGYCRECQEAAAQRLKVVRDAADVALLGTLQTKEATWKRMSGSAPSVATPSCPVSGSATTSDST